MSDIANVDDDALDAALTAWTSVRYAESQRAAMTAAITAAVQAVGAVRVSVDEFETDLDSCLDANETYESVIRTSTDDATRRQARDAANSARRVVIDLYRQALITSQPEPTFPPVSGGSPEMDDDETACGALCQQANDAAWAKLGPVDETELPF